MSAYSLDSSGDELSSDDDEELSLDDDESLDEELSSLLLLLEKLSIIIGDFLLRGFIFELFPLFDFVIVFIFGTFSLDFCFSGVLMLKPLRLLPTELEFFLIY